MFKQIIKDGLGWGFLLWLFGYALGMVLFTVVPAPLIGWIILPVGTAATLWVLLKKIPPNSWQYYVLLAAAWVIIAAIFDYLFIVKALHPADGYYKLDVYIYYSLTFILPIVIGWVKKKSALTPASPRST